MTEHTADFNTMWIDVQNSLVLSRPCSHDIVSQFNAHVTFLGDTVQLSELQNYKMKLPHRQPGQYDL